MKVPTTIPKPGQIPEIPCGTCPSVGRFLISFWRWYDVNHGPILRGVLGGVSGPTVAGRSLILIAKMEGRRPFAFWASWVFVDSTLQPVDAPVQSAIVVPQR